MINSNPESLVRKATVGGGVKPVKALVLGLGGTGVSSLLCCREQAGREYYADLNRFIRWIGIDISEAEQNFSGDSGVISLHPTPPDDLSNEKIKERLANDRCFSWLPNPDIYETVNRPGGGGAGTRSLARFAFFLNEDRIRNALSEQIESLASADGSSADGKFKVFIIASSYGCTGSGIFFDTAALVRDICSGMGIVPELFGIAVLPSAIDRSAVNGMLSANSYAFFKELDYFNGGGIFSAEYPSGREINIPGGMFDYGRVYLLDSGSIGGVTSRHNGRVCELAGHLVLEFIMLHDGDVPVKNTAGGTADAGVKPVTKDSLRGAVSYSSFGFYCIKYPVIELKEAAARTVATRVIDSFFRTADRISLAEVLGDINSGLMKSLRIDCKTVFERMNPGYAGSIESEISPYRLRAAGISLGDDNGKVVELISDLAGAFSSSELERNGYVARSAIERRNRLELLKAGDLLNSTLGAFINDHDRGLKFADEAVSMMLERFALYRSIYLRELDELEMYSDAELDSLLDKAKQADGADIQIAEAAVEICAFNYRQMLCGTMLNAAAKFTSDLRMILIEIKCNVIDRVAGVLGSLNNELTGEIETLTGRFAEGRDHFCHYIAGRDEVELFIERYFSAGITTDEICSGLHLVEFPERFEAPRIPGVDEIKDSILKMVFSRTDPSAFDNISVTDIAAERGIAPGDVIGTLYGRSRPWIFIDESGLSAADRRLIISRDKLDADSEIKDLTILNDLSLRIGRYSDNGLTEPEVTMDMVQSPDRCAGERIIAIGILSGFPLPSVSSLERCEPVYHQLIAEKRYPLHIFNSPAFDARYLPDPMGRMNYLNPARLWSGLLMLKLVYEEGGVYRYRDDLADMLREPEARVNYNRVVAELARRIESRGRFDSIDTALLVEVISGLGMLAKSTADGLFQFRRDLAEVMQDIMERYPDEVAPEKVQSAGCGDPVEGTEYRKFASIGELAVFIDNSNRLRSFLVYAVKDFISRSAGSVTAGADISLPLWKIGQTEIPVFRNRYDFFDYFEKRGSLEWQNILAQFLKRELNGYINSSKFMIGDDPGHLNIPMVNEFLKSIEPRMPVAVISEIRRWNSIA